MQLTAPEQCKRLKWLTCFMFLVFAMTTDAVGVILPELISQYGLTLTQASAFHYAPMVAIAFSGIALGFLADRWGRKPTILLGLALFSAASVLFFIGETFAWFLALLVVSGLAIGLFKTGALALLGDITTDSKDHSKTMNTVEGFFAIGAIIGPAIVTWLLTQQLSWKWVYLIAASICVVLFIIAQRQSYPSQPTQKTKTEQSASFVQSLQMVKDPMAFGFALAIALYVATEVAIYVWMPSLLKSLPVDGWFATYALTVFFVFRAAGRFIGSWLLNLIHWKHLIALFTGIIFMLFLVSVMLEGNVAVWCLPATGLFMSILYPTLNSKGISCFAPSQHGAVAGLMLFFTALSAAVGPFLMALLSDFSGNVLAGFYLATGFAGLLFLLALYNWFFEPAAERLQQQDSLKAVTSTS